MAWSSKKQYAIMMSSKEGKDLIEKMPDLSQDEFQEEFSKLLGKSGEQSTPKQEDKKPETKKETKYVYKITSKQEDDVRKKFKYVFRKADKEYFDEFMKNLSSCGEDEKALFFQALYETVDNVYQGKGEGYFSAWERKIIVDRAQLTYENCYAKYGVAFHEFGHAIDYTIGDGIKKGQYASCVFEDEEGNTMKSLLKEECNSCDWNGLKDEINKKREEFDNKRQGVRNQLNELEKKKTELKNQIKEQAKQKFIEKYGKTPEEYEQTTEKYDTKPTPEESKRLAMVTAIRWGDMDKLLYYADSKTLEKWNSINYGIDKYYELYYDYSYGIRRIYGDISDIHSGFFKNQKDENGKTQWGLVNMGHSTNYWNDRGENALPKECFAELFQGKTVNPRSYEVMSRYFPKTVKMFEKIVQTYGENYAKRFGDNNE